MGVDGEAGQSTHDAGEGDVLSGDGGDYAPDYFPMASFESTVEFIENRIFDKNRSQNDRFLCGLGRL